MDLPPGVVEMINAQLGPFNKHIGLRFVSAATDEFVSELTIEEHHRQPYGLVHGGVYSSLVETTCSTGAAVTVFTEGKTAVGLENSTSFLKAVRGGILRCTARPLVCGSRSHVWQADITDDDGRLVATGRVRMMILEPGASAGGKQLQVE
jgi:1,4-dihydroxy-2-naphthoyl-CoA hydrolase